MSQVIDLLNNAFGSTKTVDHYRGELSLSFLKPREHILDFISRVRDLRCSILDAERRANGIVSPVTAADIDAFTARSFCNGLPADYRIHFKPVHYVRPFEAFQQAITLARQQDFDRERFGPTRRNDYSFDRAHVHPIGRPLAQSTPTRFDNGQWRDDWRNTPTQRREDSPPTAPNPRPNVASRSAPLTMWRNNSSQDTRRDDNLHKQYRPSETTRHNEPPKWCRYCKNSGHEIEECRKRAYNNSQRNAGNYPRPSRPADNSRAGAPREQIRPVQVVSEENPEGSDSQS